MRWSHAFVPTLRDDPAEAVAPSHRLLVRAGFIRQLMSGSYSLLPAAMRVRAKIMQIIREEIDAIGGQEFLLPALHPSEVWKESGRWEVMGDEMFKLHDRKGAELALGMTHEEIFTGLALELRSYRDLPQLWYQIQTKFRDEPRPKSGVLRLREFTMKDSYTFDIDADGLDLQFERHRQAYLNIFRRCGMDPVMVEASSGAMGGRDSVEFMVFSDTGEDEIVTCECGYAANLETAVSSMPPVDDPDPAALEKFPTPGVRTIKALSEIAGGAPADRQIKTLVYEIDGELTLILLRGDHDLMEQKLRDHTGAAVVQPAAKETIVAALGAAPGSLGAVDVDDLAILADPAVAGRRGFTTGANEDDFHLRNVDVDRDISVDEWVDLRTVTVGEACIECGEPLRIERAIEVGHIFKLGTTYADTLGARVLAADGSESPLHMGSYGIGVERAMAAVVETSHDDKGIVWPVAVAPYHVVITVLRVADEATMAEAEKLYLELQAAGVEVILDDRDERPGVKFADAELVGVPYRITVGPRGLANGIVELTDRSSGETTEVSVGDLVSAVAAVIG